MIVRYSPTAPLWHILGGCIGIATSEGLATFGGVPREVSPGDVSPALLWWRKGAGKAMGPYTDRTAAQRDLWRICSAPAAQIQSLFNRAAVDPVGAEIVSGGYWYRVAWGGDEPPPRFTV